MSTIQFWSGLETIGGNIVDISTDKAHVVTDFGFISDPETGTLPALDFFEEETAVFITHLHLDHTGNLPRVPEHIPIYMSRESYTLYQKLIEIGEEKETQATVYPLDFGQTVEIGDIKVTFEASDHDIRGAAALFIETPDKRMINSGDVRLSGNHPEKVEQWVKKAKEFAPDYLLLEGTAFSFDDSEDETEGLSESELYQVYEQVLEKESDAIVINTYIRNTERLSRLIGLTSKHGRKMVLEPDFATLLSTENQSDFEVLNETISLNEIEAEPDKYVFQNRFKHIDNIKSFESGVYLHSNGEPLGDYDERFEVMHNIVTDTGLRYQSLAASGHAKETDIIKIAKTINAKNTIPWHTMNPQKMYNTLIENKVTSLIPELGKKYI